MIQKGLAFLCEQSGTVTVPGAPCAPSGSCPAGCMAKAGLRRWRHMTPHQRTEDPDGKTDRYATHHFVRGGVNMTISLAFLAPTLVQAAVERRLPRGIGVTRLRDAPAEWGRQYAMLGLSV